MPAQGRAVAEPERARAHMRAARRVGGGKERDIALVVRAQRPDEDRKVGKIVADGDRDHKINHIL